MSGSGLSLLPSLCVCLVPSRFFVTARVSLACRLRRLRVEHCSAIAEVAAQTPSLHGLFRVDILPLHVGCGKLGAQAASPWSVPAAASSPHLPAARALAGILAPLPAIPRAVKKEGKVGVDPDTRDFRDFRGCALSAPLPSEAALRPSVRGTVSVCLREGLGTVSELPVTRRRRCFALISEGFSLGVGSGLRGGCVLSPGRWPLSPRVFGGFLGCCRRCGLFLSVVGVHFWARIYFLFF